MGKRRELVAVRDFPSGCGRNVPPLRSLISIEAEGADNSVAVKAKGDGVKGAISEEFPLVSSSSQQKFNTPLDNSLAARGINDFVKPSNHGSSESLGIAKRHNGLHDSGVSLSRRSVYALRQFPPFCGRNAPPLSTRDIYCTTNVGQRFEGAMVEAKETQQPTTLTLQAACEGIEYDSKSQMVVHFGSDNYLALQEIQSKDYNATRSSINTTEIQCKSNEVDDLNTDFFDTPLFNIRPGECSFNSISERYIVSGLAAVRNDILMKKGTQNMIVSYDEKLLPRNPTNSVDLGSNDSAKRRVSKCKVGLQPGSNGVSLRIEEENQREHDKIIYSKAEATLSVNLPPRSDIIVDNDNDNDIPTRSKIRNTLRVFHAVCRKLLQAKECNQGKVTKRIDLQAAKSLKEKGHYINHNKCIGSVPGVEVGDEFQYRVELNIVGLHRLLQGGIDFIKVGDKYLATSIVASGGYDDNMDDSDVLIYTGSGGNFATGSKQAEDQKLEYGNLALKNSFDEKNPIRVIRGDTNTTEDNKSRTYVYDGLYEVDRWWQDFGSNGKLVFKFKLVRRPGQPQLSWKVVRKSKKSKLREGICEEDISKGKEVIPICAVNTIDGEKPPSFEYVTRMTYPSWIELISPRGCECGDCSTSIEKCPCLMKNGGELPYNYNGAIVEAKPIVYECGPSCKCPPSCYNRVTQNGIRFQLEIFKTESRGWGVRSLNFIPSGSFICEYMGELLEDREAEQRAGNDEYLFDIGSRYDENSKSGDLAEDGFTIDAALRGNIGRFVNHSCSPNLYAQNVLYDHEDKKIPHIMLFASENIPQLRELTYDYNYVIDAVRSSDGNIKRKDCFCGSADCSGRMY